MKAAFPVSVTLVGLTFCVGVLPAAAQPAVVIDKHTNGYDAEFPPGPLLGVGSSIQWTYQVTNTGDVVLTNVAVTDDQGVLVSCPKSVLDAGESMVCTGSGVAVAGPYANVGTVNAQAQGTGVPVSDNDASHYFGQSMDPAVSIDKSTNGEDAAAAPGVPVVIGEPVIWTYSVTNQGPVTLTNVQVVDDQGVEVTCPKTTLMSGETMTCVGVGVAVAGQYANVGTASGDGGSGSASDSDTSHYFGVLGIEGCGPGFWKKRTAAWPPTGYSTSQSVSSAFAGAASYPFASVRLIDALSLKGGNGVNGAAATLVRASVAALLGASHPDIDYPLTPAEVLTAVNAALATNNRSTMLELASLLGWFNGFDCPID